MGESSPGLAAIIIVQNADGEEHEFDPAGIAASGDSLVTRILAVSNFNDPLNGFFEFEGVHWFPSGARGRLALLTDPPRPTARQIGVSPVRRTVVSIVLIEN